MSHGSPGYSDAESSCATAGVEEAASDAEYQRLVQAGLFCWGHTLSDLISGPYLVLGALLAEIQPGVSSKR